MEEEQKDIQTIDERYGNETLTIERNLLCKYSGWKANVFIVLWTHREGMTKEDICEYLRTGPGPAHALKALAEQGIVAPDKDGKYTIQEKYLDMSLPPMPRKSAKKKAQDGQKVVTDIAGWYYRWLRDPEFMNYLCTKYQIIVDFPRTNENLLKAMNNYHNSFVSYLMTKGDTQRDYDSLRNYFDHWLKKAVDRFRRGGQTYSAQTASADTDLKF